jgi:glycosyltransferase involved in cell wall biosynthesis
MKVIHIINGRCNPESANGVDKSVYYLTIEQAKSNNIWIFSLTKKDPIFPPGVNVISYSPKSFTFKLPEKLITDIKKINPDIVHFHSVFIPFFFFIANYLIKNKIPYVVTPHGGLSKQILNRRRILKYLYGKLFEIKILNSAKFIHSVSDKDAIKEFGVISPIIDIHNGFNISTIPNDLDENFLIKRHPQFMGKRIFLFLGRFDVKIKGLDLLIKALSTIDHSKFGFILIGPDYKGGKNKLKSLIKKYNLNDCVVISDPLYKEQKFSAIKSSDIFVHTSRSEGTPLAILEAAGVGKPCLITEETNMKKYILKFSSGWFTKTDVKSIAESISKLAIIPQDTIDFYGMNSKKMIKEEFDWKKIAKKLNESYLYNEE